MAKKKSDKGKAPTKGKKSAEVRASFWDRLTPTQRHGAMVLSMIVLSFLFFAPVHFSGKSLIGGDTVSWRAQAQSMIEYRNETGEEPLWDTNVFGGMPGYYISYENAVPQVDSIARVLRKIIWPSSHFIFLLVGTYLCGFLLTRNELASLFGSVAYGFTTYIPVILAAGHNTKFITLCFAPWMIAAFIYTLRKPGPVGALLFSVATAAVLRGDHVQIAYYFSMLGLVWWIVEGVSSMRAGDTKKFISATLWLGAGAIVSLLMVAQPYLPALEYKALTMRGTGELSGTGAAGLDWTYAMSWSQGKLELLTLLIADAFGGAKAYWGPKIFTGGPHYMGAATVVLAIIALVFVRSRTVTALGVSLLAMLVFAVGENLAFINHFMFDFFPLFSAFRVPETWLISAVFVAALLGATGLDYLATRQQTQASIPKPIFAFAGIALLLIILLVGKGSILSFEKANERRLVEQQISVQNNVPADDPRVGSTADQYMSEVKQTRREAFTKDAVRSLLVIVLIGLLALLFYRGKLSGTVLMIVTVVVIVIDLTTVARRYLSEENLTEARAVEDRIPKFAFDQYILDRIDEAGGPGNFRVLSLEGDPTTTARPSFYYESLSGYHAAKLQIYQDYLEELLVDDRGVPRNLALDLMNVRYVVARAEVPGFVTSFTDEQTGFMVQEREYFVPRAYFVSATRYVEDPAETLELLKNGSTNIWYEALVDTELDIEVVQMDSSTVADVALQSYGPRRIVFNATTDATRLMTIAEVYYPAGWKAYIDGDETPIVRTNYIQRGVVVPEGTHEVVLEFEPARHKLGIAITATSTGFVYLFLAFVGWRSWSRRREDMAELPSAE